MSSDNIAIRVQNLSKCYQIYGNPRDRLKQFVLPRLQRISGQTPSQYFREFWALNDVSFEVNKGETVGIIGRNGSGKSTLLQMICGTISPTGGSVATNGRIAALLELGSGFNPQFTGRENVYMYSAVLGLSKEEVDARYDDIAAFADIGQFIDQPVKNYSSGMTVRLAFAVQAMIDPDIFIVDEALAVGDEKFQRKCHARLEKLKNNGTSILFVSHAAAQITELCDKVLFLEQGNRLMYNSAAETVRSYRKLIFSSAEDQKKLAKEYQLADQSDGGVVGKNNIDGNSTANNRVAGQVGGGNDHDSINNQIHDDFDPNFIPVSTVSYPVQGAEIKEISITDSDGRRVNILTPGECYKFVITGQTIDEIGGIHFGLNITTTSGICVTGQRYPETGKFVEFILPKKNFSINFLMRMDLLPGTYFAGGGIWSSQEPNCVHRLLDALMFRVLEKKQQKSFGYVDLSVGDAEMEVG